MIGVMRTAAAIAVAATVMPAAAAQQAPPAPPSIPDSATKPAPLASSGKLSGMLYVYSFLDVRENEFTPKVLAQFDADLIGRLQGSSLDGRILHFKDSPVSSVGEFYAGGMINGGESRQIPVIQTIARNLPNEAAVNARYRLIVFPSQFTMAGAWRYYDIRFIIMDTATNHRLFTYNYSGRHMVVLKSSENFAARSKKILDKLFEQLKLQGLI